MAGGFGANTRRKIVQLADISPSTSAASITQINLPKTGLLGRIWLAVRGTLGSGASPTNSLGWSSVINRFRVNANSGIDIYNLSGASNSYMLGYCMESEYFNLQTQNQGVINASNTSFNLDTVIPVALNMRDPLGLIMLQNEQTVLSLTADIAAPTVPFGASGVYSAFTITPYLELFTVPVDPNDWPPLNVVHQCLEDTQTVSGSGNYTYYWPRGNVYLQVLHGLGLASGTNGPGTSDGFAAHPNTAVSWRVNQSDYIEQVSQRYLDMEFRALHGNGALLLTSTPVTGRPGGTIWLDLLGTSGLGNYGQSRDLFNSALVTDVATVINASGAGTLYTVRRQIVVLQ